MRRHLALLLLASQAGTGCAPDVVGSWQASVTAESELGSVPPGLAESYTVLVDVGDTSSGCRIVAEINGIGRFTSSDDSFCDDRHYRAEFGGQDLGTTLSGLDDLVVGQHGMTSAAGVLELELRGHVMGGNAPDAASSAWTRIYQGHSARR